MYNGYKLQSAYSAYNSFIGKYYYYSFLSKSRSRSSLNFGDVFHSYLTNCDKTILKRIGNNTFLINVSSV